MENKIVIIESVDSVREFIVDLLKKTFTHTKVICITKEQYEGDILDTIATEDPAVIIVSVRVTPWKNEIYGSEGIEILSLLRTACFEALIISTSMNGVYLEKASNFAHIVTETSDFPKIIEHIGFQLELSNPE
jgi:DNA-binding NarL/FixJ family response regulator